MMQQLWGVFTRTRGPPPPASVPSDMSTETTTNDFPKGAADAERESS